MARARQLLSCVLSSVAFGAVYGHVEYRYITPYRPLMDAALSRFPLLFSQFYPYHYFIMLPIFLLASYLAVRGTLPRPQSGAGLTRMKALAAWLLTAVLAEDVTWFGERVLWPRANEGLPGQWILCPLEWTCLGLPSLGPLPLWHIPFLLSLLALWLQTYTSLGQREGEFY